MYIQNINDFWYDKTNFKNKYSQNFKGNIIRNVGTFKLGTQDLTNVSRISNYYTQLDIMFKTAGNYMADLFKKGIQFLIPAGAIFTLKNTLKSDDVQDIKIEKNNSSAGSDELVTFTISGKDDVAKIVVSKDGTVNVLADEDLSENDVNKYLNEISQNHDKLFTAVTSQTKEAINSIGEILSQNIDYDFDLSSKTDMQKVVKQFIDEKKTISLLTKLIHLHKFMQRFEFEEGMPHKMEEGELRDKNIYFSFSNLSNQFFDAMRVTAIDNGKNTVQGFVAFQDGNIYKTKELPVENNVVPRVEWGMRKLFIMSPEELENPDLKEMFKYAYSHTDKMYRGMMQTLYRIEKEAGEKYESVSPTKKAALERALQSKIDTIERYGTWKTAQNSEMGERTSKIDNEPLDVGHARVLKVYDLDEKTFNKIKEIDSYNDRISKAYSDFAQSIRDILTERSGIIRKKYVNGFIFTDMLKSDDLYLGLARYTFGTKRDELINFGIFDKDYEEVARFKVMPNGNMQFVVKPTDTAEQSEKIEKIFNNELKSGLLDKLSERMNDICYYHENASQVNKYVTRAGNLTALQAVKEMRNGKTYYQADTEKIQKLKNDLENIKNIYYQHRGTIYSWQKDFFKDDLNVRARYLHGYIDKLNVNYEFGFTENERCSGLRVALKDDEGNCIKCYMVDYAGNVYKLVKTPPKNRPRYFYIDSANMYQLSVKEVLNDKLDVVLSEIYNNIEAYNKFLQENSLSQSNKQSVTAEKPVTTEPKKRGRPRKNSQEAIPKAVRRIITKPAEQPKIQRTDIARIEQPSKYTISEAYPVKPFVSINMENAVAKINKIIATPYEERSPHLVHDLKSNGDVFMNRFSVSAPDGAWVTVSVVQSGMSSRYYSIRVQKDNQVMYMNLNPETGRIYRCDADNNILHGDEGRKLTILKEKFAENNPLSANMSMYFDELFAERPETERKTISWQLFKKQDAVAKQAMHDFERAMRRTSAPEAIQKEIEAEFKEEQESEEQFDEPEEE